MLNQQKLENSRGYRLGHLLSVLKIFLGSQLKPQAFAKLYTHVSAQKPEFFSELLQMTAGRDTADGKIATAMGYTQESDFSGALSQEDQADFILGYYHREW